MSPMTSMGALIVSLLLGLPPREDLAEAVERLVACKDMGAPVCVYAAATLTNAGPAGLRPTYQALPRMGQPGQILSMTVLGADESAASTQLLVNLLADRKMPPLIRSLAVSLLAERRDKQVQRALLKLVEDPDASVRAAVIRVLGNWPHGGDARILKALAHAALDRDKNVRREAVLGLGLSGRPECGPALVKALHDVDDEIRRVAADGLKWVKYAPAVKPLIEALNTEDTLMRRSVAGALTHQTGKNFGEDYPLWREWHRNQ